MIEEWASSLRSADQLITLLPGVHEKLPDTTEIPTLPSWANVEKIKKGQQFGLKYLYGLNYSQTLSLLYLFAPPGGTDPLIFTERSHTPSLAHKRYLSTALRVKSWYETEFWRPCTSGYDNLKFVKTLHLHVSKRLGELSADQIHDKCNLPKKLRNRECVNGDDDDDDVATSDGMLLCPLGPVLKVDFEKNPNFNAPAALLGQLWSKTQPRIHLNQFEMSATQFGFFGLMLLYPHKLGAKNATDEELDCFVHMWKLIGYFLGIKNQYNFCNGTLAEVKLRSQQFVEFVIRPLMMHVTKEWEHMSRCAFLGIEKFTKLVINFESTLLYFCWLIDIPTPYLMQYVGWKELFLFRMSKILMTEASRIPGFVSAFNYRVTKNIEKAAAELTSKKESKKLRHKIQYETYKKYQFD